MSDLRHRSCIKDALEEASLSWDDDYIKITLTEEFAHSGIVQSFIALGYVGQIEDECVDGLISIYISNAASNWSDKRSIFFFSTKENYWLEQGVSQDVHYFFITECKSNNFVDDASRFCQSLVCFRSWRDLLEELSDHKGTEESPESLVFFVGSDKGARKYEVIPRIALDDLLASANASALTVSEKLLSYIRIEDAQHDERKETMRVALVDYLDDCKSEKFFVKLLEGHTKLFDRYQDSYHTYMHRFSINEILEEVAEKNIDYTNRLNDSISSAQLKAFAIPGALIAVGALVKSVSLLDLLLVCLALLMVKKLTVSANQIHLSIFNNLERQVTHAFSRYKKTQHEQEVKSTADRATSELSQLIEKARSRISNINKMASLMLYLGWLYLFVRLVQSSFDGFMPKLPCLLNCYSVVHVAVG